MANVTDKFSALVQTNRFAGEWTSWVAESDLPREVACYLRERFLGTGSAWDIAGDRWFTPEPSPLLGTQTLCLVANDATMPCLVSGNTDYSAWDD